MLVSAIDVNGLIQNMNQAGGTSFLCSALGSQPPAFTVDPNTSQGTTAQLAVPNAHVGAQGTYPILPILGWKVDIPPGTANPSTAYLGGTVTYVTTSTCFSTTTTQDIKMQFYGDDDRIPLNVTLSFDGGEPIVGLSVHIKAGPYPQQADEETGGRRDKEFGPVRFSETITRQHKIKLPSLPKSKL